MAELNLLTATSIKGKTSIAQLLTTSANVITNSSGSSATFKLNNIILTNYSNNAVSANVIFTRGISSSYIGGNISVPGNATLVLLGKDTSLYMEESDVLQANAGANGAITLTASYEWMS